MRGDDAIDISFDVTLYEQAVNNHEQVSVKPGANESQKTRNKKQNGLAHSRFNVCVTPKQKKHSLIRESCLSGTCAKQPINNVSEVTWLCTLFSK